MYILTYIIIPSLPLSPSYTSSSFPYPYASLILSPIPHPQHALSYFPSNSHPKTCIQMEAAGWVGHSNPPVPARGTAWTNPLIPTPSWQMACPGLPWGRGRWWSWTVRPQRETTGTRQSCVRWIRKSGWTLRTSASASSKWHFILMFLYKKKYIYIGIYLTEKYWQDVIKDLFWTR